MRSERKLLDLSRRVIRLTSISHSGNEQLAGYLARLMSSRGMEVKTQQVTHSLEQVSKRQFNVVGILGDPLVDRKIRKGLLLSSHLDTVSPGQKRYWTSGDDPFELKESEGRLIGSGVSDGKLDFVCKFFAAQAFLEKKLKMPLYLVGTCGAHLGMFGSRYLIESLALNPKYVMVGVPTSLHVATQHKGLQVFRLSVSFQTMHRDARGFNRKVNLRSFGQGAHSAFPEDGRNAFLQLMEFLQLAVETGFELQLTRVSGGDNQQPSPDISDAEFYLTSHHFEDFKRFFNEVTKDDTENERYAIDFGGVGDAGICFLPENIYPCLMDLVGFANTAREKLRAKTDSNFDPPFSTLWIGEVQQKATRIDLDLELYSLPDSKMGELEKMIRDGISEVSRKYPSLNISMEKLRMNPPLHHNGESELTNICKEVLEKTDIKPETSKLSISTDAGLYRESGYDAVAFGPGTTKGNLHRPNESISVHELQRAIDFYENLIARICL